MDSNNSNKPPLMCHKHGQTPSLVVAVEDQVRAHYCLICFEEMLARQGVHAMFPAPLGQTDSTSLEEWPSEIEEVK